MAIRQPTRVAQGTDARERDRTTDYEGAYGGAGRRPAHDPDDRVATGLGWFSIGLGLVQLVAPGRVSRLIGVRDDAMSRVLQRVVGMREIGAGVGILTRPKPAGWVWARVAGDVMDLALLGAALRSKRRGRGPLAAFRSSKPGQGRAAVATAAVVGITLLDLVDAVRLSRRGRGKNHRDMRVTKAITVNRSPDEVYGFWRDFENLPRFMDHLESVQVNGGKRSHWKAKAPAGKSVEWDAEIVDDRPNELIAWRSVQGADVDNAGSVRFKPAPGGRGTEVHVEMEYAPPGGVIGATVAKLFGEEPEQQVGADLRAFKQVMETGEIVRSDASIHSRPHAAQPPEAAPGQ